MIWIMDRFFFILQRVNSVVFLLVALGMGGATAWSTYVVHQWSLYYESYTDGTDASSETYEADPSSSPAFLKLGDLESVTDTDHRMLLLTTERNRAADRGEEIRNILFITDGDRRSAWLFPNQNNLILTSDQIRPWRSDDSGAPTEALYFEFVAGDPEDEFGPTEHDLVTVALAKSDGTGMVEVLQKVDEVLSYRQVDANRLSIIYRDIETLHQAHVSLNGFAVLSDEVVLDKIPAQLD
jgi:hypothetical protein